MAKNESQRSIPFRCYAMSVVVLFGLLVTQEDSNLFADESAMNAIDLLSMFSGENATQYENAFRYSENNRIVAIEIHAVGMQNTTARYSGQEDAWYEVNNILRITTADGFEGISGVDTYYQENFSDAHFRELQSVVAELIEIRSLDPVIVSATLEKTRPELSDETRASIDIALWDLAARKAGQPLYKVLGAKRDSIEPYASLPFYRSLPEYVEAVNRYAKLGFTTFKFHVWGSIDQDLELVELIQRTFADSPYRFMIDLEGAYDFDDAVRLGEQMDQGLFVWLEGPVNDELLGQYRQLRERLATLVVPAGYSVYSPAFIRAGIEADAWDAGRFDATVVGGISKALELLVIANEADIPIDVQSWGHSLAQAANLHLMLANDLTRYFEAPMPKEVFEFGMTNGNLLEEGRVVAPKGPGLGIDVDWDQLAKADFYIASE